MSRSCWSLGSRNPGQNQPTAKVWWGCAAPTAGPRTLLLPRLLMSPPARLPRGCQRNGCFTLSTSLCDLQTHPVDWVQIMCQQQLLSRALRKDTPNLCVVLVVGYMLLMWEAYRGVFPSYSKGFRYSVVKKKKCSLSLWPRSRLIFLKFCAIFLNWSSSTHLQWHTWYIWHQSK